jgi:hypothetical protein
MGDSFADLRRASREPGGAQAVIERKRGGSIPPDRTFDSGKAAVSNARHLAAKGDISNSELTGVEESVARKTRPDRKQKAKASGKASPERRAARADVARRADGGSVAPIDATPIEQTWVSTMAPGTIAPGRPSGPNMNRPGRSSGPNAAPTRVRLSDLE